MRIIFLCFEYAGNMDPGSGCIKLLRGELHRQGISSDVLTYAWQGEKQTTAQDEYGTIYIAPTWYRHARVKRQADGAIRMSPVGWARVALTRGYAMLREGRCYAQRGVPVCGTKALGRRLRRLCEENEYDWVVSVAYPFANHLAAVKWIPQGTKLALYNLDPYWNNYSYPAQERDARRREEADVYRRADVVFCTPEQQPDYTHRDFQDVYDRICPISYPKLKKPQMEDTCALPFDSEKINLLYLGTVYGDVRKPEALLKLFERASKLESRLQLYIVGKKFGADADRYLREYKERLGDALIVHEPIPASQTADLLSRADILVNLGNTVPNQMPSKTIEYIATGKPIVNISVDDHCNTIDVLKRYPLCLQCFNRDAESSETVTEMAVFCQQHVGQTLAWNTVSSLYQDMQLTQISECFIRTLTQTQ